MGLFAALDRLQISLCLVSSPSISQITLIGLRPGPNLCVGVQHTLLNHTLSRSPSFGVVDQFWAVQSSDVALAEMGVRIELSYFFDGEQIPSVAFEPALPSDAPMVMLKPLCGRSVEIDTSFTSVIRCFS